jgi:hypothetical protein
VAPLAAAHLAGSEFVAHNAAFDRAVLGEAAAGAARFTCTVALCRQKLGRAHRLKSVADLAGHVPAGAWHRAAADALACRAAHRWLLLRPDLTPEQRREARLAAKAEREGARPDLVFGDPRLVRIRPQLCPEPTMAGQRWTPAMDERLRAMWQAGHDVLAILELMPRTPAAIFARLEQLGLIEAAANPYVFDRR